MASFRRTRTVGSHREPVLGTVLHVQVSSPRRSALVRAERAVLAEVARLEPLFSVFDPNSELRRWTAADGDVEVSDDLCALLALALDFQQRSGGAFNPAAGVVDQMWRAAESSGEPPTPDALADVAAAIAQPRYRIAADTVHKLGDCDGLTFNALAKGLIVDCAARRAWHEAGVDSLIVNLGGDLVHLGSGGATVAVENPSRPFDNEPALAHATVRNAGLATSGRARRGYRVGGRWYGHVLDPRTGWPTDGVGSATVVAGDAAAADALATIVSVLGPEDGLAFVAREHPDAAALVIGHDGSIAGNAVWVGLSA